MAYEAVEWDLIPPTLRTGDHPPTVPEPTLEQVQFWILDGLAEATDGCEVEPDGLCPHGHKSWLLHLGYV